MASASSGLGGSPTFHQLEGFYAAWHKACPSEIQEKATFKALSPEQKAAVLKAFQCLTVDANVGTGTEAPVPNINADDIGILQRLVKDRFKLDLDQTPVADIKKVAAKSFNNISSIKEKPATKTRATKAEQILKPVYQAVYQKSKVLEKLFGEDFSKGIIVKLGLDVPNATIPSYQLLAQALTEWARALPDETHKKVALAILAKREEGWNAGKIGSLVGLLNEQNIRGELDAFVAELGSAVAARDLTSKDKAALTATGLRGISRAQVVGDSFLSAIKHVLGISVVESLVKGPPIRERIAQFCNETISFWKNLPENVSSAVVTILAACFPSWEKLTGMDAFNAARVEIETLTKELDATRPQLEARVQKVLQGTPDANLQIDIDAYEAKTIAVRALRKLVEGAFEERYLLVPRLASGHAANFENHSRLLLTHATTAQDMRGLLTDPHSNKSLEEYRAYLRGHPEQISPERKAIEDEAFGYQERALLWGNYASSQGDPRGSLVVARLLCFSDPTAWSSADRTEETFRKVSAYIDKAIRDAGWLPDVLSQQTPFREEARAFKKYLLLHRLEVAGQNDEPIWKDIGHAHRAVNAVRTNLRALSQLAEKGLVEARDLFLKEVRSHFNEGRVSGGEVASLTVLAAEGFKEAENLIAEINKQFERASSALSDEATDDLYKNLLFAEWFLSGAVDLGTGKITDKDTAIPPDLKRAIEQRVRGPYTGAGVEYVSDADIGKELQFMCDIIFNRMGQFDVALSNIPVARKVDLKEITERSKSGTLTSFDIDNLTLATVAGTEGAKELLTSILGQRRSADEGLAISLSFAAWVLDTALPAGMPPNPPFPDAEFAVRYQKLLNQQELTPNTTPRVGDELAQMAGLPPEPAAAEGAAPVPMPSGVVPTLRERLAALFAHTPTAIELAESATVEMANSNAMKEILAEIKALPNPLFPAGGRDQPLQYGGAFITPADLTDHEHPEKVIGALREALQDDIPIFIGYIRQIDEMIEVLKKDKSEEEKRAIEQAAASCLDAPLSVNLFGDGNMGTSDLSKDALAAFIIRHRKELIAEGGAR